MKVIYWQSSVMTVTPIRGYCESPLLTVYYFEIEKFAVYCVLNLSLSMVPMNLMGIFPQHFSVDVNEHLDVPTALFLDSSVGSH
jgi:hypothetical protein